MSQNEEEASMDRMCVVGVGAVIVGVCCASWTLAEEGAVKKPGARGDRFAAMDTDGNGTVSLAEFKAASEKRTAMRKEKLGDKFDASSVQDPEKAFVKLDKDSDGCLTKKELAAGWERRRERAQDVKSAEPKQAPEAAEPEVVEPEEGAGEAVE